MSDSIGLEQVLLHSQCPSDYMYIYCVCVCVGRVVHVEAGVLLGVGGWEARALLVSLQQPCIGTWQKSTAICTTQCMQCTTVRLCQTKILCTLTVHHIATMSCQAHSAATATV